jgi:molecular chaperone DnaK (HSP70)
MTKKASKTAATQAPALEAMKAHGQASLDNWIELVKLATTEAIACAQNDDDIEALEAMLNDIEDAVGKREDEIDAAA